MAGLCGPVVGRGVASMAGLPDALAIPGVSPGRTRYLTVTAQLLHSAHNRWVNLAGVEALAGFSRL
jgi:hypothetical protein